MGARNTNRTSPLSSASAVLDSHLADRAQQMDRDEGRIVSGQPREQGVVLRCFREVRIDDISPPALQLINKRLVGPAVSFERLLHAVPQLGEPGRP